MRKEPNEMHVPAELIEEAYYYLKRYAYQEKLNLFLKYELSKFEKAYILPNQANVNANRLKSLPKFFQIANELRMIANGEKLHLEDWINSINFNILPKSIKSQNAQSRNGNTLKYYTNIRNSDQYSIDGLNYYINMPIQLWIIDILWTMVVGPLLEEQLDKECYGNRLESEISNFYDNTLNKKRSKNADLFKYYFEQYSRWRDEAILTAKHLNEKSNSVALFSIDLKQCYYNITADFVKIHNLIKEAPWTRDRKKLAHSLTDVVERIHISYNNTIREFLKITHPEADVTLPIGIPSSSVIANWYLAELDFFITDQMRPDFYGRYVDDLLFVFKNPKISEKDSDPVKKFIEKYFKSRLVVNGDYRVKVHEKSIPIQDHKIILQYYRSDFSTAALDVFKKEIDERASAFSFMPIDDSTDDFEKAAYNVLYEGSTNTLRSIVGLEENEIEISKYLLKKTTVIRMCNTPTNNDDISKIKTFLKGENALKFLKLWERIYQYLMSGKRFDEAIKFKSDINAEVKKITNFAYHSTVNSKTEDNPKFKDVMATDLIKIIQSNLSKLNSLAFSLTLGAFGTDVISRRSQSLGWQNLQCDEIDDAKIFRTSNMVRHHLAAWPLINYTQYEGDITDTENVLNWLSTKFQSTDNYEESHAFLKQQIKYSPRYIHFDEWQIFKLATNLNSIASCNYQNPWLEETITSYQGEIGPQFNSIDVSFKKSTTKN